MATRAALEQTLKEAFNYAQLSRKDRGLAPMSTAPTRKTRDGTPWIGPSGYKITLWLPPWHYADLLRARQRAGFKGSITKFLHFLIESAVPAREMAARPEARTARVARLKSRTAVRRNGHLKPVRVAV